MVDPVRMGPVSAVAAAASRSTETQKAASNVVNIQTPRAAVVHASPSLPRLLDLAADLASSGPPVDYTKVAQVRRAIADGSYQIDANALAKAVLRFAANE